MMGTPSLGADEALASTSGKDNYQRLARVIVVGGTSLLREVFDSIHPPNKLFSVLTSPAVVKDLSWINKRERQCLYPSAGKCGSSVDFDITMLYKLLKTICKLPEPTGKWHELPDDSDTSLSADLARIRCYRNSICHDSENMEIQDDKFLSLWASITGAIVRIAQWLSKGSEWKSAVDKFLTDPLTLEDMRHVEELTQGYLNDMEQKKALKELKDETSHIKDDTSQIKGDTSQIKDDTSLIKDETSQIKDDTSLIKGDTSQIKDDTSLIKGDTSQIKDDTSLIKDETSQIKDDTSEIKQLLCAVMMRINCKKVTYGTSQPHTDEILKLIEKVYLKTHNPSGPDEENKFQEFMAELGTEMADTFLGSLVITLKINSLQILENLWNVYCSGYLGEKVQSCLATDYVLNKLNLRELQLETTILKEDYEACRRHFTQSLETPVKTEKKEISEEVQETAETPVKTEEKEISEEVQGTVDFSCRCDEKKLDLIVLVEQTASLRFFKKLKAGLIQFVQLISMMDYDFRMALVSYQVNGVAHVIESFTRDVAKMKSCVQHLKRHDPSFRGSHCGLAHGLQLAVGLSDNVEVDDDSKCRKDANKICILLPNIYEKQPNPKDYLCEHGYDVIQLCRQLLVGGVSLTTTIAKQKPLDWPYLLISDKDLMEEFFQGISLKTGGQLLKAKDVRQLSEIFIFAVKEQISLERLIGCVEDFMFLEICSKPGKELSREKVVEELTVQLRARSCRRDVIDVKNLATAPPSELAKKLACVDDMKAAIDILREAESGTLTEKMEEQAKQVSSIEAESDALTEKMKEQGKQVSSIEAESGALTEKMEEQEKQVSSIEDKDCEITDDTSRRLVCKAYLQMAEYVGRQASLFNLEGKPF